MPLKSGFTMALRSVLALVLALAMVVLANLGGGGLADATGFPRAGEARLAWDLCWFFLAGLFAAWIVAKLAPRAPRSHAVTQSRSGFLRAHAGRDRAGSDPAWGRLAAMAQRRAPAVSPAAGAAGDEVGNARQEAALAPRRLRRSRTHSASRPISIERKARSALARHSAASVRNGAGCRPLLPSVATAVKPHKIATTRDAVKTRNSRG